MQWEDGLDQRITSHQWFYVNTTNLLAKHGTTQRVAFTWQDGHCQRGRNSRDLAATPRTRCVAPSKCSRNVALVKHNDIRRRQWPSRCVKTVARHRALIQRVNDNNLSPVHTSDAERQRQILPPAPAAGGSCRRRWVALTRLKSMNAPASSPIFASVWAKITLSSNEVSDLCTFLSQNGRLVQWRW